MFWLLMRIRLQSARNVVLETWRLRPVAAAAMSLAGICLFGGMFLAFLLFLRFASQMGVLEETVYQAFYYLFLLLLAGAVPFVAATLLQSADYSLLFAAPIPPRTVVAAKLLDATITNSLQFTVLGIPAIVACAVSLRLPVFIWPFVLVLIALFVLLPALLTALALLLALALLGMARLRSAITLINVLMGMIVCITFVLEAKNLPFRLSGGAARIAAFQPDLHQVSPSAHIMPSAWFARVLVDLAHPDAASHQNAWLTFGVLALVCILLYGLCMALGARLLSASSVISEGGGSIASGVSQRDDARLWRRVFSPPFAAMLVKDFKYLWRDNMLLSQLSVPLLLFLVPFLIGWQTPSLNARSELFPFSGVIVAFILFIQTSILSLSLLGMEAEGFWLTLLAPVPRRTTLWAKWLSSTLASGGTAFLLSVIAGLTLHAEIGLLLAQMVIVVLCAAGLCGLGVGISAMLPRFIHENPALRVSPWALIVSFFATTAYMVITLLVYGFTWILAASGGADTKAGAIIAGGFAVHTVVTLVAVFIAMSLGIRRIEGYEWQH